MIVELRSVRRKMTLEEFRALPEGPPYYEFEDGEVITMTSPHGRHQDVLDGLIRFLKTYLKTHTLGRVWWEIDVELTADKTYIPDAVYLSNDHLDRYSEEDGKIRGLPDLVVEITSPGSVVRDRVEKFNRYFAAGVPWYWIVDPNALVIEEYQAEARGYLRMASVAAGEVFRPAIFPGLEIDPQELL
jgi:Uma2 family endonuclease